LTFRPALFTMIVGKVGSGKSLLLQALIGEMRLETGTSDLPKAGVAFCAQSSWLRNATIRENILGETTFDVEWYSKVTWACALDQDFRELNRGDFTSVGSKGISLSGGQKNRIALARALYARKPTLVIDDILSGLDKTTEMLVFQRVFGRNGLLQKSKFTTILATHSVHWASEADEIVVLSAGSVHECGPYSGLSSIKELGLQNTKETNSEDIQLSGSENDSQGTAQQPLEITTDDTLDDLNTEEERRSGDKKSLKYYLSSVGIYHVTVYTILLLVSSGATTTQCK
jgi:ATP-binding cassette, subfamily C (CFTR/MRP), member 1